MRKKVPLYLAIAARFRLNISQYAPRQDGLTSTPKKIILFTPSIPIRAQTTKVRVNTTPPPSYSLLSTTTKAMVALAPRKKQRLTLPT